MSKQCGLSRFFSWLVLILIVAGLITYFWPVPSLKPVAESLKLQPAQTVSLAWPAAPEAAVGASGFGILAQNGSQTPLPIASTAKLITALTVLKKYPLSASASGPTITLTSADVAIYNKYQSENGSVVLVAAGEQITERQMLEAMMLPSANNMADSLATWAFGSLAAYKTAAQTLVNSLGLAATIIGSDASGFSPDTKSTAYDLGLIGQAALDSPALASIVSEKQANLPVAGIVQNVNWLLGEDGIIGIKTGNTNQAGGVFVFAAQDQPDTAHQVTIVGSIVGSSDLADAIDSAVPLINSVKQGFVVRQIVSAGQTLGHYDVPWLSQPVAVVASKDDSTIFWLGAPAQPTLKLNSIMTPQAANTAVGQVSTKPTGTIGSIVLQKPIPNPPWWWRLFRHRF